MKRLSLLIMLLIITNCDAFSQSILKAQQIDPSNVGRDRKNSSFAILGISVVKPLFKVYKATKQEKKVSKIKQENSNPLPSSPPLMNLEDGPIAWQYTGQGVTVIIPRSNNSGGYYTWGTGQEGGGSPPPINEDQPAPSDGGGGGYVEAPPLVVVGRKVEKSQACQAFRSMWNRQNTVNQREQVTFITDKGLIWLDDSQNTEYTGLLPAASNFPVDGYGRRKILVNNEWHVVTGVIHTHPINGLIGLSGDDIGVARQYNVPIYSITTGGIFKGMGDGTVNRVSPNYNDAFDCSLTYGLFNL